MLSVYDKTARKKPTNLSINSDLLEKARQYGVNLSSAFEEALVEIVKQKQEAEWLEINKEAIESYNSQVQKHGVFSRGLRKF